MDSLIRRIEGTLGRGSPEGEPVTADEIREARFRTRLGGYHEIAVDFALEAFIVAIEARTAGTIVVPEPPEPKKPPEVRKPPGPSEPSEASEPPESEKPQESPGTQSGVPQLPEPPEPERPEPSELEEHAVRVERAAFRPGRLGMGYDEDEVDAFLDRIVATLRGTADVPLTAADVRRARFATVLLKPGYAVNEVDDLLAGLAGVLETHLGR
ncbi:DivIVA domain-containing protein [Streptosporangium becharense]|uniref:DivIVA domain-containing protein n=1 Tax=Streptosporangium becharense TaxID=1816182 RepID=A0A7W9MG43_9ACTN|nr:DivIVA domain-containing protein [Streptosporangium becharense]MBB2910077.1 DivIVA domain-containing protein [Streptosporangium becharense]MBB5818968.1 DivIVA domain-containing protein [Streptosporangium becharense]